MDKRATLDPERFLGFTQCADCTYDLLTGEGERTCHYYTCPYLPEELDVTCPTCTYNFVTRDTHRACEGGPACDFARDEAVQRMHNLRAWAERHAVTAPLALPTA
jgi:hypothetical protein